MSALSLHLGLRVLEAEVQPDGRHLIRRAEVLYARPGMSPELSKLVADDQAAELELEPPPMRRLEPNRLEVLELVRLEAGTGPEPERVAVLTTVAYRPNPRHAWMPATAGSVHRMDAARWATWELVTGDPLA